MPNNKELTDKLISVLSKPVAYSKTCCECGRDFKVNTQDSELTMCLPCLVKHDMKLSDDAIINLNMINLWKAKRYDLEKGIDPVLCLVAEGVMLLPMEVSCRDHLTMVTMKTHKFGNDKIEKIVTREIKRSNGKYDALLCLRFSATDDFSIFKVRLSSRLFSKLSKKKPIFIKKFLVSLVVKNVLKKAKRGSKKK